MAGAVTDLLFHFFPTPFPYSLFFHNQAQLHSLRIVMLLEIPARHFKTELARVVDVMMA